MTARLRPAADLDRAALTALFNAGFADYLVPMEMDEAAFARHVGDNDVDPACSRVVAAVATSSAVAVHAGGTVLQVAADDGPAATRVLLAAASPERGLRLSNLPEEGPVPPALRSLGARPVARQLELRRSL